MVRLAVGDVALQRVKPVHVYLNDSDDIADEVVAADTDEGWVDRLARDEDGRLGKIVDGEFVIVREFGRVCIEGYEPLPSWTCSMCASENRPAASVCWGCNKERPTDG